MANTAIPIYLLHLAYNLKGDNELSLGFALGVEEVGA